MKNETIQKDLLLMGEESYREFSAKLMPTVEKETVIGIRVPILRAYAKSLEDYETFFKNLPHRYFEENNLHAFLIERERDFDCCIKKLEAFLPYVNNWATCDGMNPKVLKKEPEKLLLYIQKWITSKETYIVRYAINLLMSYYLDEHFQLEYLKMVCNVQSDEYYINMMRAWYFATALAKQYEATLPYLQNHLLDEWTHNKTIQKAVESYRISNEQKTYFRTLRRKGGKSL
ncbi:MAG: DNA alkylation repair protein [Ruminococcaceae bacterium]|nr:DNA alkylation repair protein [Oscillospiraceae bacterium]